MLQLHGLRRRSHICEALAVLQGERGLPFGAQLCDKLLVKAQVFLCAHEDKGDASSIVTDLRVPLQEGGPSGEQGYGPRPPAKMRSVSIPPLSLRSRTTSD